MPNCKVRSPSAHKSLCRIKGKKLCPKRVARASPKRKLGSLRCRCDITKGVRRSPKLRAAQPTTVRRSLKKSYPSKLRTRVLKTNKLPVMRSSKNLSPTKLKKIDQKSPISSRRIKLIDASPWTKSKNVRASGGTSVLFSTKKSSKPRRIKVAKTPVLSGKKSSRMDSRFKTMPLSRAKEGVDFFYNLGQKGLSTKLSDMTARLRGGKSSLAGGIVGGRPVTDELTVRGPKLAGRGFGLPEVSRRTGPKVTGQTRLGLSPNPVLTSNAMLAAKNLLVPLTNHLPIIDFISTTEFHNICASQKNPQRIANH